LTGLALTPPGQSKPGKNDAKGYLDFPKTADFPTAVAV